MKKVVLIASLALTACGAKVVFDEDAGGGGGGGSGGTSDTSVNSMSAGGFGGGVLVPDILEVKLGANCMPVVGEDPLSGSVFVSYENGGAGTGSLTLDRADVVFTTAFEGWVFPIELSPTSSGPVPAGSSIEVEHVKGSTSGDASFVCSLCGMPGSATLYWSTPEGEEITDTEAFDLGCVQ